MNEINFFSLNIETMMTAAVPWFPDNSQYRKLSIHGPGFRKHMYMGTGLFFFFPPRKMGPGRGGSVGRADLGSPGN